MSQREGAEQTRAVLERVAGALACGVLAFVYVIQLARVVGIDGKAFDLLAYLGGGLLLPVGCAAMLALIGWARASAPGATVVATLMLGGCVAAGLGRSVLAAHGLSLVTVMTAIVALCAALHAALALWRPAAQAATPDRRTSQAAALFLVAFTLSLPVLFRISGDAPAIPAFAQLLLPPDPASMGAGIGATVMMAGLIMVAAIGLGTLEARADPSRRTVMGRAALIGAVLLVPVLFFDFALPAEVLHHLTNVAPAQQLLHGGVLMVDTFSQYGPGPILASLLGLLVVDASFGGVNVIVQAANLAFFAAWLVWLYRIAPLRMPAMLLGLGAIAMLLAIWGVGTSNLNFAPSILGFRYLPVLLLVLAISGLRENATGSPAAYAAVFLCASWSVETFLGAVLVYGGFLALAFLRSRDWRDLVPLAARLVVPVAAAVATLGAYTLLTSGRLPDYPTYLGYLGAYVFFSDLWSMPADRTFLGWGVMLAALFLVVCDATLRALRPSARITTASDHTLFHRCVPMALLSLLMASYFAGRSVDYLVVLALLPFMGLAIPAWLWLVQRRAGLLANGLVAAGAAAYILTLAVALVILSRPAGLYQFAYHRCVHAGQCTPAALSGEVRKRLDTRQVLQSTGYPYDELYFDGRGIVREALSLLRDLEVDADRVTVLLGSVRPDPIVQGFRDEVATDVTLFYAGKWHLWPRSDTFADELLPQRVEQILRTPVTVPPESVVLVRRDEGILGSIETGILEILRRTVTLCEAPQSTAQIVAYRVAEGGACGSGSG